MKSEHLPVLKVPSYRLLTNHKEETATLPGSARKSPETGNTGLARPTPPDRRHRGHSAPPWDSCRNHSTNVSTSNPRPTQGENMSPHSTVNNRLRKAVGGAVYLQRVPDWTGAGSGKWDLDPEQPGAAVKLKHRLRVRAAGWHGD